MKDALDLDLWKDELLFRKQNKLKSQFKNLLGEVGNKFPNKKLQLLHHASKGKKVSQGYELDGLPYQVLDLIRDFDFETGLNIRILNWYGKGAYLLVLCGKETFRGWAPEDSHFKKSKTLSPWDYPAMFFGNQAVAAELNYSQWFKELPVASESAELLHLWSEEIKKVILSLEAFLALPEN